MSGKSPKQKGDRLEREIVKRLTEGGVNAKRVPLSGAAKGYPGDVEAVLPGLGTVCLECKARADFKTLYGWLEGRDGLILKGDRREPLIILRLSDFLILYREGGRMPNPNPHKARQARKRRPKPGTVKQLTSVLWSVIGKLEDHLILTADAEEVDTAELCRLTHALSQSASVYLKAVETGELEARVEALEGTMTPSDTYSPRRAA